MLTESRLQKRKRYLTATDMVKILVRGQAKEVYLDKLGLVEPWAGNEATERGSEIEPVLVKWCARKIGTGVKVRRNQWRVAEDGIFAATHDALVVGAQEGIEAKTTTQPELYGEEGTDQVPDDVIVQTAIQMHVSGLALVWVPVLIAAHRVCRMQRYVVHRDQELIDGLVGAGKVFKTEHLDAKVPPAGELPIEVLRRFIRAPGSWAPHPIPASLVVSYEEARQKRLDSEKLEEAAQAALIAALEGAEAGHIEDGRDVTYLEQQRKSIDGKALRAKYAEIADEFEKLSKYGVFRIKTNGSR